MERCTVAQGGNLEGQKTPEPPKDKVTRLEARETPAGSNKAH